MNRLLRTGAAAVVAHPVSSVGIVVSADFSGVVLAGGESRRMGRDKRILRIQGKSLLEWTLTRLRPVVSELIVVVSDPELPMDLDARIVTDQFPGMGVLAGVHAGLNAASYEWAFVVGGDMPFMKTELLAAMTQHADPGTCDVVVPRWRALLEPLHALYRAPVCAPAAERALRNGQRRIIAFYPEVRVSVMYEDEVRRWDPSGLSFFNANTPDDLEQARDGLTVRG